MCKVNIGLIGAGMIGDVHIDSIRRDGRGEVTWIASRTAKTLNDKLNKFNIPHGTTDYCDILKDKSVDAVIIASPPFTHLRMVKDCLAAEKHILLDAVQNYPDLKVLECSCRI
ncbi:Gfo/Idh/MocA family oxidoreductase [candidate division KSB1 bacterium]|nr:Gfo/Idh/MocA family oxidoreductase [candidate division KSB1 bacterium]